MTYELAKELKEAGFPQTGEHLDYDRCPYMIYPDCIDDGVSQNGCYVPTLEELIEACGDGFSHLVRYYIHDKLYWEAETPKVNIIGFSCTSRCETPEEAVANLWLELLKLNESKRDTTTRKN